MIKGNRSVQFVTKVIETTQNFALRTETEEEVSECLKFNYLYVCMPLSLWVWEKSKELRADFLIAEAEVVEYIKRLELKWSFEYQSVKLV